MTYTPRHTAHLHAARTAPHYGGMLKYFRKDATTPAHRRGVVAATVDGFDEEVKLPVEMNPDVAAADTAAWNVIMEYAREMI